MEAAMKGIEGGMGVREASRLYNIPYETLRRRANHTVGLDCKPGPPTVLTKCEEDQLASYLIKMADMGFGLSRDDVMLTAYRIAEKSGRKHPFVKGCAGRSWFDGFRARHPNLTLRSAQSLSHSRAACANMEIMHDYFAKLGAICARLNILSKPMQIYNMDETGISVVHKPGRVIAELGRRNVWAVTSGERGKTHTVLACASASGYSLPPFMIYPRKKMAAKLQEGAFPGTIFQCSESGWVTGELFVKWFEFFIKNIPPSRPALLILDGHASHVSIDVVELARANDIHMLCLPAHTTHLLQPLDVGVFKSLKTHYYKACKAYISDNAGRVITSEVIASLLAVAWSKSFTPVNIMSGFRKSGVYPLNPGEITDRELAPSMLTHPEKEADKLPCSQDLESLFQRRYEEGYDVYDAKYIDWLRLNHPESIPPDVATSISNPPSITTCKCTCIHSCSHLYIIMFINISGISEESGATNGESATSSDLSEILALPKRAQHQRKRQAVNAKAKCITDDDMLSELKAKEEEKIAKITEKEKRKVDRQRKKEETRKKKEAREAKKLRNKRGLKPSNATALTKQLESLAISSSESEAECPDCGLVYGDDDSTWVQCDSCGVWRDLKCAGSTSVSDIPDVFYCKNCT